MDSCSAESITGESVGGGNVLLREAGSLKPNLENLTK